MRKQGITTRFVVFITTVAIVIASVISPISHAHSLSEKVVSFSFWTEVCTSKGMKRLKMEGSRIVAPSGLSDTGTSSQHCVYCCGQSNGFHALPDTGGFVLPALSSTSSFPSLFYHSPHPLFAWSPAQPRGPPSHF